MINNIRKNILKLFKHKCRYRVIGTGFDPDDVVIETDLVCTKCGNTKTVFVHNSQKDKLIKQISKGKYFSIHKDFVDEKKIQYILYR